MRRRRCGHTRVEKKRNLICLVLRANKNITLTLSWNVVPNAGILPLVAGSGQVSLPFPDSYETTMSY